VRKAGLVAGLLTFALAAAPAAAKQGDVYVGTGDGIVKVNPKNGATSLIVPFADLEAEAHHLDFGRDGRLYVSDEDGNTVYRVNVKTGTAAVFADDADFADPFGLAVAPDGEVIVNDYSAVTDTDPGTLFGIARSGALRPISTEGITDAVDAVGVGANGDVYLAAGEPNGFYTVDRKTGNQTFVSDLIESPGYPEGIAVAADRRLFIGGEIGIQRVSPKSGDSELIAQGSDTFDYIYDIEIGLGGEILAVDNEAEVVRKVNPKTGAVSTLSSSSLLAENAIGIAVEPPKCKGKTATIVGTQKNDKKVKGGPFNDVIHTLGGDDKVDGKGGKDLICGGKGKDKLKGGGGKDKLFGQGGKDKLDGGPGKDKERQ
jgi:Ca2+-binding RTX toxin-like protein